MMQSADWY